MGYPEFGTVRLSELEAIHPMPGVGIERDRHFKADKPISAYCREACQARYIKA